MAEENLEKKQTKSKAKVETKRKRVAKKEGENVKKTREGVKRTAKSSETKRRTMAVEKESTSIAKRENAKTVKAGKSTTTQRRKTTRNTHRKSIAKTSNLSLCVVRFMGQKACYTAAYSTGSCYEIFHVIDAYVIINKSLVITDNHTLKRKCMMSPSCTTYSFPSTPSFPASLTAASEPYWI